MIVSSFKTRPSSRKKDFATPAAKERVCQKRNMPRGGVCPFCFNTGQFAYFQNDGTWSQIECLCEIGQGVAEGLVTHHCPRSVKGGAK